MAVQEQKGSNSLERYIAEVRSVWGDGKDPQLPFSKGIDGETFCFNQSR